MAHTASLSQLQTPAWAVVNGELVDYQDVRIHISAEALTRALTVFEGLKGYWDAAGGTFAVRDPDRHYQRLCRSAALLHIPIRFSARDYRAALTTLAERLLVPGRDLWFRTTLYVTEGHWGEGTEADLVITAFTQPMHDPDPMRLAVSTWRRGSDAVTPARIKCGANYLIGRLARMEARRLGYDEALLLNDSGRVAEATAACVLIADDRGVATPPPAEGCLNSITVDALELVCAELGVPFTRRPIDRTELLVARECALAGTITELTPVEEVDGHRFDRHGVLARVRRRYLEVMRGATLPGVTLVPLPVAGPRPEALGTVAGPRPETLDTVDGDVSVVGVR